MTNPVKTQGLHFKRTKQGNIYFYFGKNEFLYYQEVFVSYFAENTTIKADVCKLLKMQVLRDMFLRCFATVIVPERIKISTPEALALLMFFAENEEQMMYYELKNFLRI